MSIASVAGATVAIGGATGIGAAAGGAATATTFVGAAAAGTGRCMSAMEAIAAIIAIAPMTSITSDESTPRGETVMGRTDDADEADVRSKTFTATPRSAHDSIGARELDGGGGAIGSRMSVPSSAYDSRADRRVALAGGTRTTANLVSLVNPASAMNFTWTAKLH